MDKVKPHLFAILWFVIYMIPQTIVLLILFLLEVLKDSEKYLKLFESSPDEMIVELTNIMYGLTIPTLLITGIIIIIIFAIHLIVKKKNNIVEPMKAEGVFKYASLAVITNIVISLILSFLPQTSFSDDLQQATNAALSGSFAMILITTGIIVPIMEEIVFRYGIGYSLRKISPKYAIIVSAIIFGIMHGNLIQSTYAFILGLIFGYVDEREKNLLPSIIMHIAINSSSVIGSFLNFNEFLTLGIIALILLVPYGILKLIKTK